MKKFHIHLTKDASQDGIGLVESTGEVGKYENAILEDKFSVDFVVRGEGGVEKLRICRDYVLYIVTSDFTE